VSISVDLPVTTTTGDSPTGLAATGSIDVPVSGVPTVNGVNLSAAPYPVSYIQLNVNGASSICLTFYTVNEGGPLAVVTSSTYTSIAAAVAALESVVSSLGGLWTIVGDPSTIPTSPLNSYTVAIDPLAAGGTSSLSNGTTGIQVAGAEYSISNGFQPETSYSALISYFDTLCGNVTI
jgi:hypothetical protein